MRKTLSWFVFTLFTWSGVASFGFAQTLHGKSLDEWRALIAPKSEELSFTKIEWRASFWPAVIEAREKDLPILLWAMNGHPLGCT